MAPAENLPAVQPGANAAPPLAGIGLRQPHYAQVIEERPRLGFVEVHSENFFADGGAALAVLREARAHYEVSLHGVGLALGSAAGVDPWHLDRLARLCQRIEPVRVSDHACFARVNRASPSMAPAVVHGSDLLPIAFTQASLDILCRNVDQVQSHLGRRLLVENLSAYLGFADADWPEAAFLAELSRRTGCGLLLDVNNLMVNALNEPEPVDQQGPGRDTPDDDARAIAQCCRFIDQLPCAGVVGEIHLAGYCDLRHVTALDDPTPPTVPIVIDDHGSRVRPAVWSVYIHALRRFGTVPSLVEWDTALPELAVLLDEAATAHSLATRLATRLASEAAA